MDVDSTAISYKKSVGHARKTSQTSRSLRCPEKGQRTALSSQPPERPATDGGKLELQERVQVAKITTAGVNKPLQRKSTFSGVWPRKNSRT